MKRTTKNKVVSSLMICATVLGTLSTSGTALAQDTTNQPRVQLTTPGNKNNGQNNDSNKGKAGNDQQKPEQNKTANTDKAQTGQSNANDNNQKQKADNKPNKANGNNDKNKSDAADTSNIDIDYQYNNDTKATVHTTAKVGQSVDLSQEMPSDLQKDYKVDSSPSFKVKYPTRTTIPVQLASNNGSKSDKNGQSDKKQANSNGLQKSDNDKLKQDRDDSNHQSSQNSNDNQNNGDEHTNGDSTLISNSTAKSFDKQTEPADPFTKKIAKAPAKHYKDTTTPVSKQDETPLPSVQYTQQRHQVVNPMLRPDSAPKIQSSSQYDSQVPMDSSDEPARDLKDVKPFKDFSKSVLRYKPYLDKVCDHYHMKSHETLLLAIMQVESGGHGNDVMQSSESVGLKAGSLNPQQSIEQGTRYMAKMVNKAKAMDKAEHANKDMNPNDYHYYANDNRLLAQAYNFGGNFLDYVSRQKGGYSTNVAQKYSKDVVAPRLGNNSGSTYHYDNPISRMYHKTFLYTNGGNFLYGDEVEQYSVSGYMHTILEHLIKYAGQKYVFGGKNPRQGFDCSGLTSYGFRLLHVMLPSYTVTQWHQTKAVKGGLNNSKPGDLIFFKGTYGSPNFISHVGFIVDPHTMFAADSDGVGFHSLDEHYWKQHYAGVRRIPQAHKLNVQANHQLNNKVRAAVAAFKK